MFETQNFRKNVFIDGNIIFDTDKAVMKKKFQHQKIVTSFTFLVSFY